MKNWYLADYKDENGNYHTALALCDREEQAEEHFKKYDMSTVRIAAEDEIYYYRSKGCPVVELWESSTKWDFKSHMLKISYLAR